MRHFFSVFAVFAIAAISAVGLSELLGGESASPGVAQIGEEFDPGCQIPQELLPAPGEVSPDRPPTSTPEPPPPESIIEPSPSAPRTEEASCRPLDVPGGIHKCDPVPLPNGKYIQLPAGMVWSDVLTEGIACPGWPRSFTAVDTANSWIVFRHDGVILNSHIDPKDAQALQPLLEQLKPRDHFNLRDCRRIALPAGVSFAEVYPGTLVGKEYPSDYPSFFMIVETGNSWVHFDEDEVIIGSHIEPQDAEALQPVIDQLRPR